MASTTQAKAIHSMIREGAERVPFDGFTLIYMSNDEDAFELELTVNAGQAAPYELGNGYGHLAFSVADVAGERARREAAGLSPGPVRELTRDGQVFGRFFFISDPDGYRIEVLQRGGRVK